MGLLRARLAVTGVAFATPALPSPLIIFRVEQLGSPIDDRGLRVATRAALAVPAGFATAGLGRVGKDIEGILGSAAFGAFPRGGRAGARGLVWGIVRPGRRLSEACGLLRRLGGSLVEGEVRLDRAH